MKRRDFIKYISAIQGAMLLPTDFFSISGKTNADITNYTRKIFYEIADTAKTENWQELNTGRLVIKTALKFLGVPYKAYTLEGPGPEVCRIDLSGLDCVTFFENSLCMARIFKKGLYDLDSLIKEITFTRYRNGKLAGYASRLHYTSDWIYDNIKKHVVKDLTKSIGGVPYKMRVSFMSSHPEFYPNLKDDPEKLEQIKVAEKRINSGQFYYLPQNKIADSEKYLKDGDIIAVTTNKAGLDYSHTGLIYVNDKNEKRFLHASTTHKKVIIDRKISVYIISVESHTGITVVRPM